ncbi:MAG TPA: amino acid adenylation domain-containing protein [Thermoanaerobaculia bacterium]|nr:amino acid adenylation domain-containing protein [Thermoanaerobaculia bacterium]
MTGIRLSPQQRRLWLLQEVYGPLETRLEAELSGPLDREALLAAVAEAVARHDILRTSFETVPGMRMPAQVVGEEGRLKVTVTPLGPDRHGLTLTLPALCGDLETLRLLLAEISGQPAIEPMQYWQYSEWVNDILEEEGSSEDFWRRRIPEGPDPLLPGERSFEGPWRLERRSIEIDAAAIGQAAEAGGVSVGIFLLTAWNLLLQRHVGEEVTLATVLDGREFEELSGTLGPFARALPLRLGSRGDAPFSEALADAAGALAEMAERQRFFTWEPSRSALRNASRPPFLPFLFEHRSCPPMLSVAGCALAVRSETAPPDLFKAALVCTESPGRLTLELVWDATRLGQAVVLLDRFAILLESAALHPDRPAGDLEILTGEERRQLFAAPSPPAPAGLVHDLFEARARLTPDTEALRFGNRSLSYAELALRARSLARRLRDLGVGPDVRVGLCADTGPAAIVGILGIWMAGGAYVPVDPHGPAERRDFFLDDSGARVLVASPSARPAFDGETVLVDLDEEPSDPGSIDSGALPESLAYVLYTSGSTGVPKGVGVEHRQLAGYLSWVDRVLFGDRVRSCPFLTPLTFDACLKQAVAPLLRGEAVWGLEGDVALDLPALLAELARRDRIGVNCTPTLWRAILEEIERSGSPLPGVARVFLGGERLPPELLARTAAAMPGTEVWNLYGPTEATANAAAGRLAAGSPVVLGHPIEGARIYLLDRRLQPVPPGSVGEIHIGGAGVARGYLERPALTAERFVPDLCSGQKGARLYRSGDIGRLTEEGIEFLGRIDHQVKLRGFRIELGEVEARLELHPEVREAAVLVREDRLVAFVVPDRSAVRASELRSALREALPEYMVPSAFVLLDRLPRLPSGKVDRAALPADVTETLAERPAVPPRTPVERRLAEIWADVLGRESVGIEDNFFELGGHSIQSIQISHRATAAGIAITPRDLLHHPTIAGLAALAEDLKEQEPEAALVPDPDRLHEPFPLSDIQQAYLVGRTGLFELGGVGPTSYVEADWPELEVSRLEVAWNRLVERHPMLRAVILPEGRWQVLPEVPPYELSAWDDPGTAREEMSSRLFEPDRWPLFELRVTRMEGGRARLHVARDLLIGDARSSEVLLQELMLLYRDPHAPETALPPLEVSVRDYALAVDALRDQEAGRQAWEYWRERLAGLPLSPDLPLAPKPGRPTFVRRHGEIGPDVRARLEERAARAGITPSVLLCAVFAEVLAAWSRGDRFSINVLYSRRLPLHPQVDRLVGNLASTVLLEVDAREATFERRAARLQERLWEDLRHGLVSGIEILRRLQGGSTRAGMPVVFSSVLPLVRDSDAPPEGGPELVFSSVQTPQVALEVLVTEVAGTIRYTWNSVEEAFPSGFVAAMFEAYRGLLEDLAGDPSAWRREGHAPVPPGQLARRREVNATAAPEPGWLLHEPIAESDEVAVVAPDRRLTYAELSREADLLVPELSPGRLVAVVMEKGWEQAVAVLAILRAGAAYLPVDPALPEERRCYLLEHGEAEVALTQPRFAESLGWPRGVRVLTVEPPPQPSPASRERGPSLPPSVGRMSWVGGGTPSPAKRGRAGEGVPSDLAYVLFTSGSTGTPKGVMIDHRAAVNTVADINRRFGISSTDRVLALSSLSFDLSVWDLFGLLGAGGRVVMPDPEASRDPAHWHELILREGVTVWNSVPALMELYAEYLESRGDRMPESLRLVLLSGDWIPLGLPGRLRALGSRAQLISLGGATEASIWSILFPVGEVDPAWKSIPYGRPMANQTFEVLDERLDPCPDWVTGQLHIGGIGLAQGYWKDEEKTRASFFHHPRHHPRTGERLYRTGDLGRWLPDGSIELLGREDLQVKIQGYRVELGEVEAALARHPAVRDAVVTAVGEARGHKRLVAWFVPRQGVAPPELRAWLEARLPDYMVPHLYVPLEALPLTANGKVDRKALPVPEVPRKDGFVAPRTPIELRMARLWEEVLGTSPIGIRDELFALGGDSMLALRLLAAIEKEFGRRLPLAVLFQEATVEKLAALVEAVEPTAS